MKKTAVILSFLAVFALVFCSCKSNIADAPEEESTDGSKVFCTVNGENITFSEIEYFKKRDRSDIINEYAQKYSLTDFSSFWQTEFDGKTPLQALEERALEDAVTAKIKLVLMRENGIYSDISFEGLKALAQGYNDSNSDRNTVGLTSIDLDTFYTYYLDNGEMELKNILSEGALKPSETEINAYLQNNKDASRESAINALTTEKYNNLIEELLSEAETVK